MYLNNRYAGDFFFQKLTFLRFAGIPFQQGPFFKCLVETLNIIQFEFFDRFWVLEAQKTTNTKCDFGSVCVFL